MTHATPAIDPATAPAVHGHRTTELVHALGDCVTIAQRNLVKVLRAPEILISLLASPLLLLVIFAYVFGGSIEIPGSSYREFLVGGTFAQVLIFGATFIGAAIAEDMQKGVMDRFRSLPMSRAAVVFGRTASDVLYGALTLVVVGVAGYAVGWRIRGSVVDALLAVVLLLAFAYAISWVMAYVGLLVPSPEAVNNASFIVIFPLTFVANTFAPSDNMPDPLRVFAEWNPVSAVTQAARELFGNLPAGTAEPTAWSLQHPVAYTIVWVVVIIGIFAPLAVRRYARAR